MFLLFVLFKNVLFNLLNVFCFTFNLSVYSTFNNNKRTGNVTHYFPGDPIADNKLLSETVMRTHITLEYS